MLNVTKAFIAFGSNIEPEKSILKAIKLLSGRVRILKASTVYLTEPLLQRPQPKYYNCVIEAKTEIEPHALKFDVLRGIEAELGRERTIDKHAPRRIDLDLIAYDDLHISTKELVIPDPQIHDRPFLAIPLYEIEPDLILPGTNEPITEVANRFRNHRMIRLEEFTETLQDLVRSLVQ